MQFETGLQQESLSSTHCEFRIVNIKNIYPKAKSSNEDCQSFYSNQSKEIVNLLKKRRVIQKELKKHSGIKVAKK